MLKEKNLKYVKMINSFITFIIISTTIANLALIYREIQIFSKMIANDAKLSIIR